MIEHFAFAIVNGENKILLHTISNSTDRTIELFKENLVIYTSKQMFQEKGYNIVNIRIEW